MHAAACKYNWGILHVFSLLWRREYIHDSAIFSCFHLSIIFISLHIIYISLGTDSRRSIYIYVIIVRRILWWESCIPCTHNITPPQCPHLYACNIICTNLCHNHPLPLYRSVSSACLHYCTLALLYIVGILFRLLLLRLILLFTVYIVILLSDF